MEDDIRETGRCKNCEYKKPVHTNGDWQFKGCYHRPYTGKWVAEIKDCPKDNPKYEYEL